MCIACCEDGVKQMFLSWIYSVGRRRAVEEGAGRRAAWANQCFSFLDWPPFTGCWHACYIKKTPPTAAPDNLQHWRCWEGERHSSSPQLLFASLSRGADLCWRSVDLPAFLVMSFPSSIWAADFAVFLFFLSLFFFLVWMYHLSFCGDLLWLSFSAWN